MNMENNLKSSAPLANRLRPETLEEFVGQEHLVGEGKYLNRVIKSDRLSSMIFYGPPGVGKTTLARIIANTTKKRFIQISAVTSNLKELREVLLEAENNLKYDNKNSILFIDEIHRFNKTQQDALLPFVEKGIVVLIGATTENPYFEINKALISRTQILTLESLGESDLKKLIYRALKDKRGFGDLNVEITPDAVNYLANNSSGDGRNVLNSLEIAVLSTNTLNGKITVDRDVIKDSLQVKNIVYDKNGNEHYDTASAFIKSIRGTDPDAALFYLAKMLESGEDPKFIARRLIISASEDISNADPMALVVAVSAFEAVNIVGLPEARINLAQATTYLASAPKSNAAYLGINEAISDIKTGKKPNIPMYLRDIHSSDIDSGEGVYKYPHNYKNNYIHQQYLPEEFKEKKYYRPSENGYEKKIILYLEKLKNL
ncbi:putative ATPase [Anaerosphaera aminiphila DSM 21120]|uniref:Putative ATPase n=2 Tax=Anaerosphaera TaxID=1273095 RepID=A0A1M5SZI3_9FIRM|nr:putative ATPase [Anaerosphaera aminiphila DSM 21120]